MLTSFLASPATFIIISCCLPPTSLTELVPDPLVIDPAQIQNSIFQHLHLNILNLIFPKLKTSSFHSDAAEMGKNLIAAPSIHVLLYKLCSHPLLPLLLCKL